MATEETRRGRSLRGNRGRGSNRRGFKESEAGFRVGKVRQIRRNRDEEVQVQDERRDHRRRRDELGLRGRGN